MEDLAAVDDQTMDPTAKRGNRRPRANTQQNVQDHTMESNSFDDNYNPSEYSSEYEINGAGEKIKKVY